MKNEQTGPQTGILETPLMQMLVSDPEKVAHNIARAMEAGAKAAAAYAEPRETGENRNLGADQIADVVRTLAQVGDYWLRDPARAVEAQTRIVTGMMSLWSNTLRKMNGEEVEPVASPAPNDKRFADTEWNSNLFFDTLKQAYLIGTRWAESLVGEAHDLDPHIRHKAEFYVRQLSAALSPSNYLFTNPELLRETITSNGENLVRGLNMLAEDLAAGHGDLKIRQTDPKAFAVGKNLALSPGKVVLRTPVAEIIQYEPTTPKVLKRPLVIVPPWINKFYILDLTPEKSMIKWAVDQGHTVFVVSWANPDETLRDKNFEQYMKEGILAAVEAATFICNSDRVDTVGYCVGGTLLAVTLGYCAAVGDERIASATLLTTQVDFTQAGDLKVFVDEEQIASLERAMEQHGYLEGTRMAAAFNMLRANDMIWPYFVNNYMKGKDPLPFDLLYWNSDSTRMPAANHAFYLRNCYLENNLSRGRMKLGEVKIDLSKVTVPIYNFATKEDHIAPPRSVFNGSKHFGGPVKFVLGGSGHIAGVINHPARNKYQYWTGGEAKGGLDHWLAHAEETAGSWWPDWHEWLRQQEPAEVKARKVGKGKFKPLCEAPGTYVLVRS